MMIHFKIFFPISFEGRNNSDISINNIFKDNIRKKEESTNESRKKKIMKGRWKRNWTLLTFMKKTKKQRKESLKMLKKKFLIVLTQEKLKWRLNSVIENSASIKSFAVKKETK